MPLPGSLVLPDTAALFAILTVGVCAVTAALYLLARHMSHAQRVAQLKVRAEQLQRSYMERMNIGADGLIEAIPVDEAPGSAQTRV